MSVPVKMPQLGESVVEGSVVRWLKRTGDAVKQLEPLLEISTDKIDTEVPSPMGGVLLDIVVAEGETVKAGTVLAHIGEPGEQAPGTLNVEGAEGREADQVRLSGRSVLEVGKHRRAAGATGRVFISPVVAKIAAEHGVDLKQVPGTGVGGRITKKDILLYVGQRSAGDMESIRSQPWPQGERIGALAQDSGEVREPLTAMRKVIARHMADSKRTSPHVTTVFEADMAGVVRHRERHKAAFAQSGVRLTFTPYFVAAAAMALRAMPVVNARFHEDGDSSAIIYHRHINIGVAVSIEQGLIVPVINDADEKNLRGLARAVGELTEQARTGKLPLDSVHGGTFTITNHGVSGSLIGTPIINQPQAGILGIGAIVKRPVVRSLAQTLLPSADDAIAIRPMCYLSLTFDHRVLDGAQADRFVGAVKEYLEAWPVDGYALDSSNSGKGYAVGYMMSNYDYDVVVVGSGPGGYVAAIRAAQLGLRTAVVERENLGGVCLNWGCIPTKALIHNAEVLETLHHAKDFGMTFENLQVDFSAAVKRSRTIVGRQVKGVNFLMRKNKIDVIDGHGVFADAHSLQISPSEYLPEASERTVTAANFIVAVGARARGIARY